MIAIQNQRSQNLYGASNPADLLLCRSVGVFSFGEQQRYLTDNHFVCEGHVDELLTYWKLPKYNHLNSKSGGSREPICSFPSIEPFNNLHTRKTKITGRDLPQLSKQQAEFILNNYGVFLHPGLCKFNSYFKNTL